MWLRLAIGDFATRNPRVTDSGFVDGLSDIARRLLALYDSLVARGFIRDGWDGVLDHDREPRGSIVSYLQADEEWLALEEMLYGVSPTMTVPPDDVCEAVAITESLADGDWEDNEDGTTSAEEWVAYCLAAIPYGARS